LVVNNPIQARVDIAVKRALRYARLRDKPQAEQKVALMYYNYPVGKANIGASYLNIAESLAIILQNMKTAGYDLGDAPLDADSLLADIGRARNVGGFAPGELEEMIA